MYVRAMPSHTQKYLPGASPGVCVVGAGVIGLSSAVNILEHLPSVEVTLIADRFSPDTTSDVAAGILFPHALNDTPEHFVRRWSQATRQHLLRLHETDAHEAGVQIVSGYLLNTTSPIQAASYRDVFIKFEDFTEKEHEMFGHKYAHGCFITTVMSEGSVYTPWLLNKFWRLGGKVIVRKVNKLEELVQDYNIIINCTGIGAKDLLDEPSMYAYRGQVVKAEAAWFKHCYILNEGENFILPGKHFATLGGTRAVGDMTKTPYKDDINRILDGCEKLQPSVKVKDAKIAYHAVGFRPCRSSVRLEAEYIQTGNKTVQVIHNYGHGGSGFTLHHGCAMDVLQLLKTHLNQAKL